MTQGDRTERSVRNKEALESFESHVALPMLVLSLAIIPLLVVPLTVTLSRGMEGAFAAADWVIWAAFAVEYGVRLYLAPHKAEFIRSNVFDLLIVALPFLRPLRVVRSARMLRLLRAGRAAAFLARGMQSARDVVTRHKLHYAVVVGVALIVLGSVLVLEFERSAPGATIKTFPDALWWAISTIATVGYGDLSPVSPAGRGVGVVLMLFGIGLFGLLAASLASFFLQGDTQAPGREREVAERLERLEQAISDLNQSIRQVGARVGEGEKQPSDSTRHKRSCPD